MSTIIVRRPTLKGAHLPSLVNIGGTVLLVGSLIACQSHDAVRSLAPPPSCEPVEPPPSVRAPPRSFSFPFPLLFSVLLCCFSEFRDLDLLRVGVSPVRLEDEAVMKDGVSHAEEKQSQSFFQGV